MKNKNARLFRIVGGLFVAVLLLTGKSAMATTHVVQFGGSLGFIYSPSSFSAHAGDTVKWEGDFSMHPLSSTSVPAGAASFHMGSGTSFSYVIETAGTYDYRCDTHVSVGMIGSFTVASSAVLPIAGSTAVETATARPFLSGGQSFIRLIMPTGEIVSGSIFALNGSIVGTLESLRLGPGVHKIPLLTGNNQAHLVRLMVGKKEIVTKFM